jgi:hypothetical protein
LVIVNLTVWDSLDGLFSFTYRSDHKAVFARRFDWFERSSGPNVVMWWQPAGTIPTIDDALRRLRLLADNGPTPEAFNFKHRFRAPGLTTGHSGSRVCPRAGAWTVKPDSPAVLPARDPRAPGHVVVAKRTGMSPGRAL